MTRPTAFLLHALGGSARGWDGVIAALEPQFDCVALDLPGFGDRAGDDRVDVEQMLDWLAAEVRARQPAAWIAVGHSMGGKLATLIAARAQDGARGLSGLVGVVLLAGSPPSPEPIAADRRAQMVGWCADGPISDEHARGFISANIAAPLGERVLAGAVADVRRSNPAAWLAWLERGSREDWSALAGVIDTPALIVAGADDGDLGETNQRALNAPHYRDATIVVVPGAAHLLPLEQPDAVAALIARHWERVRERALPQAFARVLASDRVSERTRRALLARIGVPDTTDLFSVPRRAVLAALIERILPGHDPALALAARVEAALTQGKGDGWRFAELPADAQAWTAGLDTLLAGGFAALVPERQDALLEAIATGTADPTDAPGALSPAQLRLWFEDVRAEAVRAWLSQPATMARIGYDGFANGGDGQRKQGYLRTGADDSEAWQLPATGS